MEFKNDTTYLYNPETLNEAYLYLDTIAPDDVCYDGDPIELQLSSGTYTINSDQIESTLNTLKEVDQDSNKHINKNEIQQWRSQKFSAQRRFQITDIPKITGVALSFEEFKPSEQWEVNKIFVDELLKEERIATMRRAYTTDPEYIDGEFAASIATHGGWTPEKFSSLNDICSQCNFGLTVYTDGMNSAYYRSQEDRTMLAAWNNFSEIKLEEVVIHETAHKVYRAFAKETRSRSISTEALTHAMPDQRESVQKVWDHLDSVSQETQGLLLYFAEEVLDGVLYNKYYGPKRSQEIVQNEAQDMIDLLQDPQSFEKEFPNRISYKNPNQIVGYLANLHVTLGQTTLSKDELQKSRNGIRTYIKTVYPNKIDFFDSMSFFYKTCIDYISTPEVQAKIDAKFKEFGVNLQRS